MCKTPLLQIRRFFCCCSLKTGSFIIGYLGLLGNVLQIAGGSAQLHYIQAVSLKTDNISGNNGTSIPTQFVLYYTEYMAIAIAYHAVSFLFNCALVWGIHKSKTELILPWLIIKGLECILVILVVIIATIVYSVTPGMDNATLCLLIAIFILCTWLVFYTYMCVNSYYHELKSLIPEPERMERDFPPVYIKSFIDEKKQNEVDINQGVV